jgi:hypothetical protein
LAVLLFCLLACFGRRGRPLGSDAVVSDSGDRGVWVVSGGTRAVFYRGVWVL